MTGFIVIAVAVAAIVLITIFIRQFRGRTVLRSRTQTEDALKHLFDQETGAGAARSRPSAASFEWTTAA